MASPSADDLQLSEAAIDLGSPAPALPDDAGASSGRSRPQRTESRYTSEEARDEALRRELDQVRGVNKAIEDVIESLQKAKTNMHVRVPPGCLVLYLLTLMLCRL